MDRNTICCEKCSCDGEIGEKKAGSNYQEVILEAGGVWGPKQVFRVVNYKDIVGVDNQLVEV